MSIEDKVKAAAKNVEGKVQETIGKVTGDSKDQLEREAKQVEATARDKAADVGQGIDDATDDAQGYFILKRSLSRLRLKPEQRWA
jgi:uncharacterized protein YjbJ (UPF0337 family)